MHTQFTAKPEPSGMIADNPHTIRRMLAPIAKGATAMFGKPDNKRITNPVVKKDASMDLEIKASQVIRINPGRAGRRIEVVSGTAWITQSGDKKDYVLSSGDQVTLPRGGMVILEGLKDAHLKVRAR